MNLQEAQILHPVARGPVRHIDMLEPNKSEGTAVFIFEIRRKRNDGLDVL
jgi:hypothetical protein